MNEKTKAVKETRKRIKEPGKSMLVKICGISNSIDAMAAVRLGADAIGFVMGGKVLPVEVEPHAQTVREIIKQIPKGINSYLVTHLTNVEDMLALAEYINATGIQVSEDIGVENLKRLRQAWNGKIIKTIVVDEHGREKLKAYEQHADYILLDTRHAGYTGGTGVTNDWEMCRQLIKLSAKPVFLAGGLNPENLKEAIKKTLPQGVDVSTGISEYAESYLRKDRKDHEKIRKFIQTAKAW